MGFLFANTWNEQSDRESRYLWLWRLRWVEMVALLLGALAVEIILRVPMPWGVLGVTLALLLASNLAVRPGGERVRRHLNGFIAAWLVLDVVLLSAVLFYTGGAHNPFTMLYLLYVAMAVILLPVASAWWVVALSVTAFAVLFESPHMLIARDGRHLCQDMGFHLKGMVLGLGFAGAGVVYFIGSLNRRLRKKHAELEKMRGQMLEQRKFVEMSAVAATVAHELATPLGTIAVIGRDLESIVCESPCGTRLREDARLIEDSINRCRHALELAGQMRASPIREDSGAVTAEAFFNQLSLYLTEPELSRVETPNPSKASGTVHAPLQELIIMTSILLRNALEASGEERTVRLDWRRVSDGVRIEVRDEGTGMDSSVLERASEPFFTTKSAGQGMGLGLYLVRMFCQRYDGKLELQSELHRGTCASMRFPLAAGKGF